MFNCFLSLYISVDSVDTKEHNNRQNVNINVITKLK
jgi:hypothetical protein